MQTTKNQSRLPIYRLNPIQTKHPHKTCTCGACDSPKRKLPEGTRRLKIQPKYAQRVGYQEAFPVITLTGKWLQNFGFKCDSYVLISEKHGQLIIQLETE